MDKLQNKAEELLEGTGISINGSRTFDIQVHNDALYRRIFAKGSLGLGEAYMEGWWDCEDLEELFYRLIRSERDRRLHPIRLMGSFVRASMTNMQKPSRAFAVGERHYDIGDDLYEKMLDQRLIYSCGYWKGTRSLDKAQENKLDLVCRKLGLREGMKVLDIGCGWGGALKYAAEKYGVRGVGITVSRNQAKKGEEICRDLPIEIRLEDYRDLNETFDRIWSIGMIEHVGVKNYRTFMGVVRRCLKPDGLFLLHTIGGNRSVTKTDPWINKYIFPNSMIPSIRQLGLAFEDLLVMEDWHNFGPDYEKTLKQWYRNVAKHREYVTEQYGERFFRMWRYYLNSCAGAFRARKLNLWQIVLSPKGVSGGYESIR